MPPMTAPAPPPLCVASPNTGLRRRALAAFRRQGFRVVGARTLPELCAVAGRGLACALVDPALPELGERPLSRLRSEPALHRCPILLLGHDDIEGLHGRDPDPNLVALMVRVNAQLAGNAQLELLHRVSETLTASPDMKPTMNAVLRAVAEVVAFDTGTLFMIDRRGRLVIRAAFGYEIGDDELRSFEMGEGVVGWVVQNRVPAIVGDSDMDRRFAALEGRSPRSMLVVPVMVGDRVLGALSLVRRSPEQQFSDPDRVLVATIGNSAAIALENARLYEQERALALRLEELNQLYGQEREILDKLEEYDRLYTQVVSTVSHELKTPLMGIRGFAKMIRDGDVDGEEAADFAREIHDNAVRLSKYVESVLTEDAVHHGRVALDLREVRLAPLVTQVMRSLQGAIGENHELVNAVGDDAPLINGDSDKIVQILLNLIGNAVKYSPAGGRVRVSAIPRDRFLEVVVEDEGMGIPEEARSKIFDRFYRVNDTETKGISGTGLGLSIVKGLVELHGGRIWVDAAPGRGSRFHVTLPQAVYFPAPVEYSQSPLVVDVPAPVLRRAGH